MMWKNLERILPSVIGYGSFAFGFSLIWDEKLTAAGVTLVFGLICLVFGNLARFKSFSGLGFQAELWEAKQKEADDLIARLRNIMAIITTEILSTRVKSGRFDAGGEWNATWDLYDSILAQYREIGLELNLSDAKSLMDKYFLFDLTCPAVAKVSYAITQGKDKALARLQEKGGEANSNLQEMEGLKKYDDIVRNLKEPFTVMERENLARLAKNSFEKSKTDLGEKYGIVLELPVGTIERLDALAKVIDNRPVVVTKELLGWAAEEH